MGQPLPDHRQIRPAWLRQDYRGRARWASVGCITTAAGALRAQRGKNVCADMRNECHLPQRVSQPLDQAEHADEGWLHVHDAPDDTNRRGADSGLSDVWRRGSSESSSTRKVMIDDSGERDTRAGIGKLTDAEM